jgi:hypothetical protein
MKMPALCLMPLSALFIGVLLVVQSRCYAAARTMTSTLRSQFTIALASGS